MLRQIKKSLNDLESIKNYDTVVNENRKLRQEISHLKRMSDNEAQGFHRIIQLKNERIEELESYIIKYDKKRYTLRQLDKLVEKKLDKKIQDEISRKVEERWNQQGPTLLSAEAKKLIGSYPNCPPEISKLINSIATEMRDKFLQNPLSWPQSFKDHVRNRVDAKVTRGMDQEFSARVNNQAQKELQQLIQIEWPRYINNHITPLCKMHITKQLENFEITLPIQCPRCGKQMEQDLTPYDFADLMKKTSIHIYCIDPRCRTFLSRTRIPITLGEVFNHISLNNINPKKIKFKRAQNE